MATISILANTVRPICRLQIGWYHLWVGNILMARPSTFLESRSWRGHDYGKFIYQSLWKTNSIIIYFQVGFAFNKLEEGYESAIKDYYKKQIAQLNNLITLLLGKLKKGDRQNIMTICTIDVHSRDVVGRIITSKIESVLAFMWQSQLRHRWDDKVGDCFANICDAEFQYWHEYLGCTPRLVITPLTDRFVFN